MQDRQGIFDCIKRNSRGNDRFDVDLVTGSYHPDGVHELREKQISDPEYGEHANQAHGRLFDANLHNVTMHMCEIDGDFAHAESCSLGIFLDKGSETGLFSQAAISTGLIDRLENAMARTGQDRHPREQCGIVTLLQVRGSDGGDLGQPQALNLNGRSSVARPSSRTWSPQNGGASSTSRRPRRPAPLGRPTTQQGGHHRLHQVSRAENTPQVASR
jgi:hypothetical protein